MKLYHYVHCPFCVRVRMVLGFLNQAYESVVLPYHDEDTPMKLMGKKMLPIMDFGDYISNESLDIIARLDKDNQLSSQKSISNYASLEKKLNEIGSAVHSLAMPHWIWTPEFDEESRAYFQKKKELKRGPFRELVQNREKFEAELNTVLEKYNQYFEKSVNKDTIELDDILIASHLWGMYTVCEFQFKPHVHMYLQSVAQACQFSYHQDFWRS